MHTCGLDYFGRYIAILWLNRWSQTYDINKQSNKWKTIKLRYKLVFNKRILVRSLALRQYLFINKA